MSIVECATYSVAEAARRIGVSKGYAYELIKRGEFPAPVRTVGTRLVVVRADLERFITAGQIAPSVQTNGEGDSVSP